MTEKFVELFEKIKTKLNVDNIKLNIVNREAIENKFGHVIGFEQQPVIIDLRKDTLEFYIEDSIDKIFKDELEMQGFVVEGLCNYLAKKLGYISNLEDATKEFQDIFYLTPGIIYHVYEVLLDSIADQIAIKNGFKEQLYRYKKKTLSTRIGDFKDVRKHYSPDEELDVEINSLISSCGLSVPFCAAGETDYEKRMDVLVKDFLKNMDVSDKISSKYNEFKTHLIVRDPFTKKDFTNSYKNVLNLYAQL